MAFTGVQGDAVSPWGTPYPRPDAPGWSGVKGDAPVHNPGAKGSQVQQPGLLRTEIRRHSGMQVSLFFVRGLTPSGLFDHNKPLYLQCPPMAPFTITRGHDSQEYATAFNGTFSVNANAKLTLVTFKTLFVSDDAPWVIAPAMDIDMARDTLRKLADNGVPFRLLCTHKHGYNAEFNNHVTLTDYVHTEDEPDAFYSDLTFKEYRDPTTGGRRHGGKTWPKHHKLTDADTLYSLAKQYYGKPSLARIIAVANKITNSNFSRQIVSLGGKWKVGVTILIPAPPKGGQWTPSTNLVDVARK